MTQGFFRVAAATPACSVADCRSNAASIVSLAHEAAKAGVALAVFPELSVTGYTCGDLFAQEILARSAREAVLSIAEETRALAITLVVGFPFSWRNRRYNCAAVVSGGAVRGIVPKTHIPNYGEFYELRHFAPAPVGIEDIPARAFASYPVPFGTDLVFADEKAPELAFACEICEDLWVPTPPSSRHAAAGALVIANLSASDELVGKAAYRRSLVAGQSARAIAAYVYADAGPGESTTDLVFSGHDLVGEYGTILAESPLFSPGLTVADVDVSRLLQERRRMNTFPAGAEGARTHRVVSFPLDRSAEPSSPDRLARAIDPLPFVPSGLDELGRRCEEVFSIQAAGLAKRLAHVGSRSVVLGVSGGLDSTLALLVAARAFDSLGIDRSGILAITMPGFGTTQRTKGNALKLPRLLGATVEEIRIHKSVRQHFSDIGHNPELLDITYENAQARERTQILMDRANQARAIVVGTGDLSELALGWATYNGDHMSMYAVNTSVPKTLVRHLVSYCANSPEVFVADEAERRQFSSVLSSILDTPVSPELLPCEDGKISQRTEHIVGPYELHDFFLYYTVRWGFSPARVFFLAQRAFTPRAFAPNDPESGDLRSGDHRSQAQYGKDEILKWMKVFYPRFFAQQFKRSCLPDGPKVGSVTLSPRGDWRMPSDASAALWLAELASLS
jgi:NAD+ synthase (glutamine-hydrolysing)